MSNQQKPRLVKKGEKSGATVVEVPAVERVDVRVLVREKLKEREGKVAEARRVWRGLFS